MTMRLLGQHVIHTVVLFVLSAAPSSAAAAEATLSGAAAVVSAPEGTTKAFEQRRAMPPVAFLGLRVVDSGAAAKQLGRSSTKTARGAPVTNSELFNPASGQFMPNISPKTFCLQANNTPACEGAGCCCWSTFGLPHHPAYPNPDEGAVKRKCMNPPADMVYVVVPGEVNDKGEDVMLKADASIPVYDGRNLCCTIPKKSPEYYSQRDVLEAVPSTKPPPTTPTTTPPPPTTTTTTTTNPFADFEALRMEDAATANAESAQELNGAAKLLHGTVDDLSATIEAQGKDPRLAIHLANNARMKGAIHKFAAREWTSMEAYHKTAGFEG